MNPVKVSEKLSVMGQPAIDEFEQIAQRGFGTIINNRPDGEDAQQPGSAAEAEAAHAAGLRYVDLPVTGASISEGDVRRFQAAIRDASEPVLAHCKSGTRSLTLWALGEVMDGRMAVDQVRAYGTSHGLDLTGAVNWLGRHGFDRRGRLR